MSNVTVKESDLKFIRRLIDRMRFQVKSVGKDESLYDPLFIFGQVDGNLERVLCKINCMLPKANEGPEVDQNDIVLGVDQDDDDNKPIGSPA